MSNYDPVVPHHFHREFPYLKDCRADHRLMGYPAILNSVADKVSSSRMDMFASHRNQALVIRKSELPDFFSGYEKEDGKYTFNSTRRDQDIEVLAVIPRYASMRGVPGSNTPWITVIYRGCRDNKVGYFDVEKYFLGSDGFGFAYDWKKVHDLEPGTFVPQDEVIACSPNLKGSSYGVGINLPTAFLSSPYCIEDAMWISESAAKWMESDEFRKLIINIPQNVRPLNLYGDRYSFKVFPDIGQTVREDGIVCAFRNVSTTTCAADTEEELMRSVNMLTDDVVVVREGSQIVNLEFIINKQRYNPAYEQVEMYHKATMDYWRHIYDYYLNHVKKEFQLTPTFNTLVTTAIKKLVGSGVKLPGYSDSIRGKTEFEGMDRQPVEFIQAVVTYRRVRKVLPGFKISDQEGGKGVISKVSRDEDMPRDDFGNIAHLVMDGNSVTARLNPSQFVKTGINWVSEFVRRRLAEEYRTDPLVAFETLIDYLNDLRPNYAQMVRNTYPTPEGKVKIVKYMIDEFIKVHIPPFYQDLTEDTILYLRDKWRVPESPVTFVTRDENGIGVESRTRDIVRIGRKYVMCLEKIPHASSPGFARVSHQGYPIKASPEAKLRTPIAINPIKTGEDELRFIMADAGAGELTRMISLLGNSPQAGVRPLVQTLMTAQHPTRLKRVNVSSRKLFMGNTILGTFHHETSVLGIDTRQTRVTAYDREFFQEGESDDVLFMTGNELSDIGDIGDLIDDGLVSADTPDPKEG